MSAGREPTASPRPAAAPDRVWWVYAMIVLAAAATGLGAAGAFATTLGFGGPTRAVVDCFAARGFSVADEAGFPGAVGEAVAGACGNDIEPARLRMLLAGVFVLPVVALLLMTASGLLVRWQLRPSRVAVPAAVREGLTARFAELCDSQGLTGRHRPLLVVAPPTTGVRDAFTTALPGTRHRVVVPLGLAHADRAAFDTVVLHEIGHVRARDVRWASAAWWVGWLVVPALLVGLLPVLGLPATALELFGLSLLTAVVGAVALLVLRAALLRRRELAADRYAVEATADPTRLAALLRSRRAPTGLRRLFGHHPAPARRLGPDPVRRWGGFVLAAAVGVVSMATTQSLYVLAVSVNAADRTSWQSDLGVVVGAFVWASVTVPAWTRRVAAGAPGWPGTCAGAVVGLVAGYFLPIPGLPYVVPDLYGSYVVPLVVALVVGALAVSVLTAALATRLAVPAPSGPRDVLSRLGAVLAVAVTLALMWNATTSGVLGLHITGDLLGVRTGNIRSHLTTAGFTRLFDYGPALLVLGLVLVLVRGRRPWIGWTTALITGVTAVLGAAIATLSWELRVQEGLSTARMNFLLYQRWWICGIAGLVAVIGVALARRRVLRELPVAVLCGLVSAAVAGGAQHLLVLNLSGYGKHAYVLDHVMRGPLWPTLVAAVVALPLLLPVAAALARWVSRRGPVFLAVGVAALVVVLTGLLLDGRLSRVTISEGDGEVSMAELFLAKQSSSAAPYTVANSTAPPTSTPAEAPHGRVLDQAGIVAVLDRVPAMLPGGAKPADKPDSGHTTVTPASCDAELVKYDAVKDTLPHTGDLARAYEVPAASTLTGITVLVELTSYAAEPRPLTALDAQLAACSRFTMPRKSPRGGTLDVRMAPQRPTGIRYPANGYSLAVPSSQGKTRFTVIQQQRVAVVGHNEVVVAVNYAYVNPPPQATLDLIDRVLTGTVNGVIEAI
ncbi:M48 family metalloprotease [Actinokineospora auranticolor]|uniref:Zn-dependent protease with chaperone function n=1 Tax=Actinokineospora auranticolor TaxID=155976 RepID=A0A2S6H176_9PSEU|nr:M48 family metalloprotease [Actinokineospora auranticolor]PPK71238.1 Zn-dependent protease with chaperone function [Actinokineospora auranticolor]